jgi:hypothetical protein
MRVVKGLITRGVTKRILDGQLVKKVNDTVTQLLIQVVFGWMYQTRPG